MSGTALILGGSGRFGRHMAAELWNKGWTVRQFDRARDELAQAAQGVDVIVNGWNPPYHKWQSDLPGQTDAIIAAARASGARVVQAANVYVFGEGNGGAFGPDHPHKATNPLGRIRMEMEAKLYASDVPLLILRSGDYLDTEASGNWFDRLITKPLAKGRIAYPGDPDVPHAWAFLPDVARMGASFLARDDLPHQLEVTTADYTLSGRDMAAALGEILGRDIRVTPFAWWQLHLARPVMPILKGVIEMRYLWSRPHWMDDSAWRAWCTGFQPTPLVEALSQCAGVSDLLARQDQPRPAHDGLPVQQRSQAPAR
ncbi:epimerase [Primorskyibacter aestuariivivens]|uniref:epimerase n=1 Tax=Primorskyibacter aestuariivivens TaxID=1888912 RepID=UPI002300F974|nr:epimerase [Primorskyibacter aestuariivivens]MDA7428276.1 epimerase [Primorskyibacter aestuariivivens]